MASSIEITRGTSLGGSGRRRKLALAALLGLMSAALIFVYLQRQVNAPAPGASILPVTVPVVTAAREIAANEPIRPDMLVRREMAEDAVLPDAFRDPALISGTIARFPIGAGEQITPARVSRGGTDAGLASVVPEGKRAMAITASAVVTAGGIVRPGDRVDVIAVVEQDPEQPVRGKRVGTAVSTVVVEDAEVLAVAQQVVQLAAPGLGEDAGATDERITAPSDGATTAPDAAATTVTLALTSDEAQLVLLHEQQGLIRLLVRPSFASQGAQ